MSYDAEEYERQAALISKQVRKRKGITEAEFLSGFARDSRLSPCITVVLYYGDGWDGATDLYGILDFSGVPEELKEKVSNYSIFLCEVRKFANTDVFQTDVRQVFDCIRYSSDPERLYELVANDPSYREMEGDTYDLIAEYAKTNELIQVKKYNKKERKVDMCKAIAELIERGRKEGMERGIEQGFRDGVRGAILELLEDLGQVPQQIVKLIRAEDDQAILSRWHKSAARAASIAEFEANM